MTKPLDAVRLSHIARNPQGAIFLNIGIAPWLGRTLVQN
nr:MAG TPA: hypothetical protein [Bacteriophage sp.]